MYVSRDRLSVNIAPNGRCTYLKYLKASYMENILSPFLCGYRKGYSAQYALIAVREMDECR